MLFSCMLRISQMILIMLFTPVQNVRSSTVTMRETPCEQAVSQCTAQAVASHTCASIWWSVLFDTARADYNNDCSVTGLDIQLDLRDNYDTDRDGRVCVAEWIAHRTSYLGFSEQFAVWHWNNISSSEDCVNIEDWTLHMVMGNGSDGHVRSVDAKGDFLEHTLQLLVEFCGENQGAMMNSSRDCLSLVSICREKWSDLAACQIPQAQRMTLQEKILYYLRSRDLNGDGVISSDEVESVLKMEFKVTGDACIPPNEWMEKLTSSYQFSQIVAENVFLATDGNQTTCVPIAELIGVLNNNVDIFTAASDLIQRIAAVCDANPELYDIIDECAHLSYTCLAHFPTMVPCREITETCGLVRARECVSQLTSDQCPDRDGQLVVAREVTLLDNYINEICDPYPIQLTDDPVSSSCRTNMSACARESLVYGKCGDTWAKFQLDVIRRDVTNDCIVDENDAMFDLRNNYDLNDDGTVCESEWLTRTTDFLGFSEQFSQFLWKNLTKETCTPMEDFYTGDSSTEHISSVHVQNFVEQLIRFCETGENMGDNLDCFGLPAICREKLPGYLSCDQLGLTLMTLNERLWTEAREADQDGDGTILEAEMEQLLLDSFDTNEDTCVSLQEWNQRWSTVYGMSSDFSLFYYSQLVKRGDCLKVGEMDIPQDGISVAEMPALLLQVLIEMCEAHPGLNETLSDCVQISDLCLAHFRSLPACKPYVDNCGLSQYVSCIEGLTDNACATAADQWEIRNEVARVKNQVKDICKAESILASFGVNRGSKLDIVYSVWIVIAILGTI